MSFCPALYQPAFRQLLFNDMILLRYLFAEFVSILLGHFVARLINCDLPVLTDKIGNDQIVVKLNSYFLLSQDELCKTQMRLCVYEFDGNWIHFPPTIHEFYAHTAILMGKYF